MIARPDNRSARTQLRRLCLIDKQFEAAEPHRRILGDHNWPGVLRSGDPLLNDLDDWIARAEVMLAAPGLTR